MGIIIIQQVQSIIRGYEFGGTLVFSFTLHYCFMGIMGRIALKCSSLSFSVASSLSFCALVLWILLLWLGMRPSGQQRCVGAISGAVVLEFPF
jgi:hypothetical protein